MTPNSFSESALRTQKPWSSSRHAPETYQPNRWWRLVEAGSLGPVKRALAAHDLPSLRLMYPNFFRDPCGAGLVGLPNIGERLLPLQRIVSHRRAASHRPLAAPHRGTFPSRRSRNPGYRQSSRRRDGRYAGSHQLGGSTLLCAENHRAYRCGRNTSRRRNRRGLRRDGVLPASRLPGSYISGFRRAGEYRARLLVPAQGLPSSQRHVCMEKPR